MSNKFNAVARTCASNVFAVLGHIAHLISRIAPVGLDKIQLVGIALQFVGTNAR